MPRFLEGPSPEPIAPSFAVESATPPQITVTIFELQAMRSFDEPTEYGGESLHELMRPEEDSSDFSGGEQDVQQIFLPEHHNGKTLSHPKVSGVTIRGSVHDINRLKKEHAEKFKQD